MLKSIKKQVKNTLIRWKYRNNHVNLSRTAEIGKGSTFGGFNYIHEGVVFKGHLGYASYIGRNSHLFARIGKYSCIAENVNVVQGNHPTKTFTSLHPAFYSVRKQCGMTYVDTQLFEEQCYADLKDKYPVVIGNDVWIGFGVTILAGVTIGDGAVIAANSTVSSNVNPYQIVGGTPAKLIRLRFEPEEIDFLVKYSWWNKSNSWIMEHIHLFSDIKKLMEHCMNE